MGTIYHQGIAYGGGGSDVTITPILQEGIKIADYEVDGAIGELYAPDSASTIIPNPSDEPTQMLTTLGINDIVYSLSGSASVSITPTISSGIKIADYTIGSDSGSLYAPSSSSGVVIDVKVDNTSVVSDGIANIDLSGKQDVLTFDSTPRSGSINPVTSDGVASALSDKQNLLRGKTGGYIQIDQDTSTIYATYTAMTGASSTQHGEWGLVPKPYAGDQVKYLRGDGTWAIPDDTGTTVVANPTGTPTTTLDTVQIDNVVYEIPKGAATQALAYHQLTEAEYNALSSAEKNNGVLYFVSDNSTGATGLSIITISQEDYDSLSSAEKNNNIPYFVY